MGMPVTAPRPGIPTRVGAPDNNVNPVAAGLHTRIRPRLRLGSFSFRGRCDNRRVTRRIPLVRRDGSVSDVALVDDEDYAELAKHSWHLHRGYAARTSRREGTVMMHRQVLGLQKGDSRQADHKNRNRLDNRRANLRACTSRENQQNLSVKHSSSSSFRGVHWDKRGRKWRAKVWVDGKEVSLGSFTDEARAGEVARDYRLSLGWLS